MYLLEYVCAISHPLCTTYCQVMNGLKYVFRPTFNVADSSMDLEASADINDKTNVFVKFSQVRD